ncbi:MAG: SNF2-related protein [Steroidobacteraceae bacterium]
MSVPTAGVGASREPQAAEYSSLVRFMAVVGGALERSRWERAANAAGLRTDSGNSLTPAQIARHVDAGLTCGHIEQGREGLQCAPAHAFAAFREVALGERGLRELRSAAVALFDHRPDPAAIRVSSFERLVAITRFALCSGLHEQDRRELLARHRPFDPAAVYFSAFGDPFDARVADLIPAAHREVVAEAVLLHLLRRPNASAPAALAWVLDLVSQAHAAPEAPSTLKHGLCEHLLWQGRAQELHAILGTDASARAVALHGAAAVLGADPRRAIELYARAERLLVDEARARAGSRLRGAKLLIPRLPLSLAFPRIAALVAVNEPRAVQTAQILSIKATRAADGARVWNFIGDVIRARSRGSHPSWHLPFVDGDAIANLCTLVAASWAGIPLDEAQQGRAAADLERFRLGGYQRAALEIDAALAMARGRRKDSAAPEAGDPDGGAIDSGELSAAQRGTLAAFFADEAPWERAIEALEALVGESRSGANAAADMRIVWVIEAPPAGAVRVEGREQKRGARGWSAGRALSSASLARGPLSARDERVFEALRHEWSHYDPSGARVPQAIAALVGHPLVFDAADLSTPVVLTAAMPELVVESRPNGGVRLRLPPDLHEVLERCAHSQLEHLPAERLVLLRDGPHRARVLKITRTHCRIAQLIGPGLEFPSQGVEALSRTLASVTRHFEVHTDVQTAVAEVRADPTIHAALTPAGPGLRVRFLVRPLGERGPCCTPGTGRLRIIAEVEGERCAALRDLPSERKRLARVLEPLALPETGASVTEWSLEDPESCLELVQRLQSLGDAVRVEWPAGKPIRVTRTYGLADLSLSIGSDRDWFALSGSLSLDDGAVMQMRALIELARASGGRYLPLGEAGFLALSDDLRRRLDELEGLGELDGETLKFPALALAAAEDTLEGLGLESVPEWTRRLRALEEAQALKPDPPSTLQAQLRPYQLDGFRWLARLAHSGAGACLADDMGLGKTVQTLALLLHRATGGAALVLAPTSVCPNWADELRRFAPTLSVRMLGGADRSQRIAAAGEFDVIICSYGLLPQVLEDLKARAWHTLVLDEAQAVKNFSTRRAQAVLELDARFRLATTGTPIENRLDELWMLFRFLNPGLLGSRERFNERFAAPIERRADAKARERLQRLIAPFVLRRTKAAVLSELPERTEIVLTVDPSAAERAFHEGLRQSALAAIGDETLTPGRRRFQVLTELMRLRRACCDPRLVAPEAALPGCKLDTFTKLAQELAANRHKALVFSQFVDYLKLVRAGLDALGASYQYLDGSTPAEERARSVRAFQAGEGDFFLISLRAGGFGLNLTAADYVVICDPWWNPAVEDQAVSRAHRMGQRRPVTVYRLVVEGSIEERIMDLHRDKRALAEGLFSGEGLGQSLSIEELTSLLREAG